VLAQLFGCDAGALLAWLEQQALWPRNTRKPPNPETAFRATLHWVGRSRSASIFKTAAEIIDVRNCQDRAFQRLIVTLRDWFPP
jgi:hypothetical protein